MNVGSFVLLRIVANPLANVLQKVLARRGVGAPAVIAATHAVLTAALAGLVPSLPTVGAGFRSALGASICLAVVANMLIVAAMRTGDLSILGPINSYKPVVSLLPGYLLLGERPTFAGLCGIALVVAGSYGLTETRAAGRRGVRRLLADRSVRLRGIALVLSAVEAVFLKRALSAADPTTTFVYWAIGGLPASAAVCVLAPRSNSVADFVSLRSALPVVVALAAAVGLMQWSTLVVLADLQVGPSLALFQLSSVLAVVLGTLFFGEPHFRKRLIGSTVMVAGAVLIMLNR